MGVVSRRWMWVECMGVASCCGCKEVAIYTPLVHFFKCFSFLFQYFLVIKLPSQFDISLTDQPGTLTA